MATKLNPGVFDCYARALPDEPMFILLARDATAPGKVREWADARRRELLSSQPALTEDRPDWAKEHREDFEKCRDADMIAHDMEVWRAANDGVWRADAPPRRPAGDMDPALRDMIRDRTHLSLCNSLGCGTAQVHVVEHRLTRWSIPGFAVWRHYFRLESEEDRFNRVELPLALDDWRISGFDVSLGDVWARVKSPRDMRLEVQTIGG